jgi:hypothetical protein
MCIVFGFYRQSDYFATQGLDSRYSAKRNHALSLLYSLVTLQHPLSPNRAKEIGLGLSKRGMVVALRSTESSTMVVQEEDYVGKSRAFQVICA